VWKQLLQLGGYGGLATIILLGLRELAIITIALRSTRKAATAEDRKHALALLRILGAEKRRIALRSKPDSEP
jgi:hypothetical protein